MILQYFVINQQFLGYFDYFSTLFFFKKSVNLFHYDDRRNRKFLKDFSDKLVFLRENTENSGILAFDNAIHLYLHVTMHKVNALEVRNAFGSVLELLNKNEGPILIEKNRLEVAVLISMEDFKIRFLDVLAKEERDQVISELKKSRVQTSKDTTSLLREIRYGNP